MMQPIPCNAALIHEQLAKGSNIPAMDINSTCTSFVTALDTMSYVIDAGRYRNVLIVSSDIASEGLNERQEESYELFSDGAAAFVISRTENKNQGVLDSIIRTYSEGAHSTEIRGGGTLRSAMKYRPEDRADYCFDMKGKSILSLSAKKLPELFREFEEKSGISCSELDMIVPHQASKALPFIMSRLGIPAEKYVDRVSQYGNMVSASIPYVLCALLEEDRIKEGDRVLLCGTAAGLTCNLLLLQL
jgi:beta-ketoacyl-acyl-carrier-protein synthase III